MYKSTWITVINSPVLLAPSSITGYFEKEKFSYKLRFQIPIFLVLNVKIYYSRNRDINMRSKIFNDQLLYIITRNLFREGQIWNSKQLPGKIEAKKTFQKFK